MDHGSCGMAWGVRFEGEWWEVGGKRCEDHGSRIIEFYIGCFLKKIKMFFFFREKYLNKKGLV